MESLFLIASAFALGAGHALEPGHGKTIVGAYLIGSRGRAVDAVLLGVIVTLTHTAGVFALGVLALFASAYFHPQDISRFLQLPAGLLVLIVGLFILRDARRSFQHAMEKHNHERHHEHDHEHEGHSHPLPSTDTPPSLGLLLTLGISGGMIPCPTALAILLAAIGEGHMAMGLIYVIAFSIGLTVVLISIGLVMVGATAVARDRLPGVKLSRWARLASGLLVTAIGVYMVMEALLYQGWLAKL